MIADLAKTPGAISAVGEVMGQVRGRVWAEHGRSDPGRRLLLDIDATLTRVHSEKEDAKGNYKRGFGFHPVACFADCSGEALAVEHRPGNAGANTIADLVGIIDAGLDALPDRVARSHRPGAIAADATNETLVRSDSAGHTLGFLWDMSDRNLRFCVTGRSNNILSSVILGSATTPAGRTLYGPTTSNGTATIPMSTPVLRRSLRSPTTRPSRNGLA